MTPSGRQGFARKTLLPWRSAQRSKQSDLELGKSALKDGPQLEKNSLLHRGRSQHESSIALGLQRSISGFALPLALDRFIDFVTMHRHLPWRLDTEPDLVTADLNDDNADVIVDDDALVLFSRQY
jgi:hypothetical protein